MSPRELVKVQQQLAVILGLMKGLDLEEAAQTMDRAESQAPLLDPLLWAKARRGHQRMRRLVGAALTFQKTTANIVEEIPVASKLILS